MPTAATRVRLDARADGVRILWLTNPAKRNALDRVTRAELAAAVAAVAADRDARVLVVSAEGPSFCAGADLEETFGGASERSTADLRTELLAFYSSFLAIKALDIPTIAAVRGSAVGAGLNLALCCDLRIAAPDARFGATFSRLGLHPGGGCSYFLTQALGRPRALRVLLSGETLDTATAAASGLIDEVAEDPESAAMALAMEWARLEPELARDIKRSVDLATAGGLPGSLEFEVWAQAASAQRPRTQAAIRKRSR